MDDTELIAAGFEKLDSHLLEDKAPKTQWGVIYKDWSDASGNISSSRTLTLAQPLVGFVRKSSPGSTKFKSFPIAGTVSTTAGLTINVQMILDE